MNKSIKKVVVPAEGLETSNGYVYPLPSTGKQIIIFIMSFFIAILLGFIISSIPGDLSELATGTLYFIFIIVFIIGYSIWVGWMKLIIINTFKRNIMRGISDLISKDEKSFKDNFIIPEEKLVELLAASQKSTWVFALIGWLFGLFGGIVSLAFDTLINKPIFFFIVLFFSAGYGHLLYYLGRRGFFPFPEE
jgi:hypothetical protein